LFTHPCQVIANLTPYEGDFETAVLQLAGDETMPTIKCVSVTECAAIQHTTERRLGRLLHQDWKSSTGSSRLLGDVAAYAPLAAAAEDPLPRLVLEVLAVTGAEGGGCLRMPPALRNRWLRHPDHGPTWLDALAAFDAKHTPLAEAGFDRAARGAEVFSC
jgi:hypothetical protein